MIAAVFKMEKQHFRIGFNLLYSLFYFTSKRIEVQNGYDFCKVTKLISDEYRAMTQVYDDAFFPDTILPLGKLKW